MKKNLTHKNKEKTTGSFVRIPVELKKEAQIWALRNRMSFTDVVVEGIKKVIAK